MTIPIRIKPGVRLRGMGPQVALAITIAAPIWEKHGAQELWVTSVTDGVHSNGSYHHCGCGLDLRSRNFPSPGHARDAANELRGALGKEYDVVIEQTHIHVEYEG
jgi:hypothetical protein